MENVTNLEVELFEIPSLENAYYPVSYRVVGTIVNSAILIIGVLGNLMVVAVVRATRSMHTPTNCYLVRCKYSIVIIVISTL